MSARNVEACFAVVLALTIGLTLIPYSFASCQIEIQTLDYPASVAPGQSIVVNSKILLTCTTSTVVIQGRADLVDEATNAVLSSSSFQLGYITAAQNITTVDLANNAQAPQASGTWKLKLVIGLYAASQMFASAQQSFQIQIGATVREENLSQVQAAQNGGFEDGMNAWKVIGRPTGYSTISQQFAHSGSASLELNLLASGQSTYEIQGVSQMVPIQNIRELNVESWVLMMQSSTTVAARLRVQVGDFTLNYYVAYGDKPGLQALDTARSKSIFALNAAPGTDQWGKWVSIQRDVKHDLESTFGLQAAGIFQQNGTTQVLTALEIMGLGTESSQIMYWDDVNATAMSATAAAAQVTTALPTTAAQTTTGSPSEVQASNPIGLLPIAVVGAVVVVGAVLVVMRRKKSPATAPSATLAPAETVVQEKPEPQTIPETTEPNIPTGYAELDALLAGGLPAGYAILLVSPPADERDLLIRKIIESGLKHGAVTFYISRDIGRTQDLVNRFERGFYGLSSQADRISSSHSNLIKIPGSENLSELNISLVKALEAAGQQTGGKLVILDILSEVLLRHKALTARKWLDDFVAKRKNEGYTILATLNPLIAPKEETQTIIDLFDGIIEIYERELRERARRFLIVKKMYGRRYRESELMLDKDKLF